MLIHVFCSPETTDKIKLKLKKDKRFTNVKKLRSKHAIKIKTTSEISVNTKKERKKLEQEMEEMSGVRSVSFFIDKEKDTNKIKHIFFDIDSTITHRPTSIIYREMKDKFARFTDKATVYFCTGRDKKQVIDLIKRYGTSPRGIAEAGGIIIGSTRLDNERNGDRREPDKLWSFIKENYPKARTDEKQQSHETEVILKQNTITKSELKQAIKKSKAEVESHATKNTYHITAKGIDKGTAILYLTGADELDFGERHKLYSVGDSDLDIPMFKVTNRSYAVKNADDVVKKAADVILTMDGVNGIDEIYDDMFGFS